MRNLLGLGALCVVWAGAGCAPPRVVLGTWEAEIWTLPLTVEFQKDDKIVYTGAVGKSPLRMTGTYHFTEPDAGLTLGVDTIRVDNGNPFTRQAAIDEVNNLLVQKIISGELDFYTRDQITLSITNAGGPAQKIVFKRKKINK